MHRGARGAPLVPCRGERRVRAKRRSSHWPTSSERAKVYGKHPVFDPLTVRIHTKRGNTREGTIGRNRLNPTHVNLLVFNTAILRRRASIAYEWEFSRRFITFCFS